MVGMVAQLDQASLAYVVQDGDPDRSLVASEFRPRRNSYDHERQVQIGGDARIAGVVGFLA